MGNGFYEQVRFRLCGDRGLLAEYGEGVDPAVNSKVRRMAEIVTGRMLEGVESVIPAYRSLCLVYDPLRTNHQVLKQRLLDLEVELRAAEALSPGIVNLPVCYGGPFGPDIGFVAQYNRLSEADVIRLHSMATYHIYAIGFAPGFCYLGGLDARLHAPRLSTPRTRIPAGSVGIAEGQTGAYPVETPGGWRLIGRTPMKLFSPERETPFLYKVGDVIRFVPISEKEFLILDRRERS